MIKYLAVPLLLIGMLVADVSTTQAKDSKTKAAAATASALATVTVSNKEDGPAMTSFGAGEPKIVATNHRVKLTKGDKIRFVWIIEDGGKTITPNAKVSEYSTVGTDQTNAREFSHLDKPASGWPLGKWRVDVYVNDARAASVKFTIK